MKFRLARRGEGTRVVQLGEIALKGRTQGSATEDLASAVDRNGGNLPVPWGRAYSIVGELDNQLQAMIYVTPPVRLVESYDERGKDGQQILADRVAEIQLLAVENEFRCNGYASQLLTVAEESLNQRGCGTLLVKVLADDKSAVSWYRKRGYTVFDTSEYAILNVGNQQVPLASRKDDPYLTGLKGI